VRVVYRIYNTANRSQGVARGMILLSEHRYYSLAVKERTRVKRNYPNMTVALISEWEDENEDTCTQQDIPLSEQYDRAVRFRVQDFTFDVCGTTRGWS
jgi:hypothetical protein